MPTEQTPLYRQAYAEFLEHAKDPVWHLAFEIYLGETFQEMASFHQGQIQAIADQAMHSELGQMRKALTKHYLSSRIEEIQKATRQHNGLTDWVTEGKEGRWVRDHGRFARYVGPKPSSTDGKTRRYVEGSEGIDDPKAFLRHAAHTNPAQGTNAAARQALGMRLGRAHELNVTNDEIKHLTEVHQRTAEMVNDLFARTQNPNDKQRIQYVIQAPDGQKRIEVPKAGKMPNLDLPGGERVHMMTPVGPDNPVTVGGQAINIGLISGMSPEQAARVGGVTEGIHNVMSQTNWGKKMQATAQTLAAVSGGASPLVQAHAFAQMVNLIGPQASRAFGGKLRQLTYRYTGQEVAPEDYSDVAIGGKQAGENDAQFEQRLLLDLAPTLPTKTQYVQSLHSGSTPPSHGYILNRNGQVVSQAVGMSDDWYTPFNLSKLPQMRGGSYVRTRSYGGLTPEDIRLAMRTGAHRATVISNNGVFSMEFNPKALHWGHRFGFAGAAMVRRYTKSLDAIKNGKIEDPSRQDADKVLKLNAEGYTSAMHDLKLKYPYWVVSPNKTQLEAFHRPLKGGDNRLDINVPDHQGDPDENAKGGYVSPVDSRANGAMHGWYENGVQSLNMWDHPDTGKHAYHTIDRYQVNHDLMLNAHRKIEQLSERKAREAREAEEAAPQRQEQQGASWRPKQGGTKPKQGGGGGRPDAPVVEGTVVGHTQQYKAQQADAEEVGSLLRDTRRFIHQAEFDDIDAKNEAGSDNIEQIIDVLRARNPEEHPDYAEVVGRLANSQSAREDLATFIGDVYHRAHGDVGRKLIADWNALAMTHPASEDQSQDDTDQGAQAALEAEAHHKSWNSNQDLPMKEVENSNAIKHWLRQLATKDQIADADLWLQHRARNSRPAKGTPEREAFNRTNARFADILSKEAAAAAAAKADKQGADDGATMPDEHASEVVTSIPYDVTPRKYATNLISEAAADYDDDPTHNDVVDHVMDQINYHREQAKAISRGTTAGVAPWHTGVANELYRQLEFAAQAKKAAEDEDDDVLTDDELDEFGRENKLEDDE